VAFYEGCCLTFIGPRIVIYSCKKRKKDALFLNFILVNNLFIKINLRNSASRWLLLQETCCVGIITADKYSECYTLLTVHLVVILGK
jgi:hypothetical protein